MTVFLQISFEMLAICDKFPLIFYREKKVGLLFYILF